MFAAAIDMGGTKTIVAIIDNLGNIIGKRTFRSNNKSSDIYLESCREELQKCLLEQGIREKDLAGLGIAVPGMFNPVTGVLIYAPYTSWYNIDIYKFFYDNTSFKNVQGGNDVKLCALGEQYFNNTSTDYLWITVSTGIGGAIVSKGNIILGNKYCAGEIGHLKVEFEDPRICTCGQLGCLQAHASGTAIESQFKELIQTNEGYMKLINEGRVKPDARGCAILAKEGYGECLDIYKKCGYYIGVAISHVLHLFNPEEVYIGGGVSRDFMLIEPYIKDTIDKYTLGQCKNYVSVKQTALGYEASLLGAAASVLGRTN
jgi:predicted NBD/HSP70 family sugar kinase